MAYIAFITAILVLIRRLGNLDSRSCQGLMMIVAILPPIGVALSLWAGSDDKRERVSVSFLGYSIPWESVRSCNLPPDPLARTGVWIGGGDIREGGIAPDTVALPGYRSHLVELCAVGSPQGSSLQARVAHEGTDFVSSSGKLDIRSSEGIHTQRIVLRSLKDKEEPEDSSGLCLALPGGAAISKADLITSVQSAWEADRRSTPGTWKRKIREASRDLPLDEGREVFCLDLASMRPCASPLPDDPRKAIDPRKATFIWLQKSSTWQVLPELGAEWSECSSGARKMPPSLQVEPTVLPAKGWLDGSTRSKLPGFSLQMVSRRTLGGAADQAVPVPVDSLSPSGFRLGPPREFRLALFGQRLLILLNEPSTQIRYDDLFGEGELTAPEGEFTLSFGTPEGGDLLAANLSAASDGYTPKPIAERWRASIRISSRSSQTYTITAPGASPESYRFGEIITVPRPFSATLERTTAPLVLISRMGTPAGILLVPALASLVLLVGILLLLRTSASYGVPWDLAMLGVILLDFRFLLTTRLWMDASPSSAEDLRWLLAGCYPILFPPLLFLSSSILSTWTLQRSLSPGRTTAFSAKTHPFRGDLGRLLAWLGIAVAVSLIWLSTGTALTFADLLSNAKATLFDFAGQVVIILLAALIAVVGFGLARLLSGNKGSTYAGALAPPPGRARRLAGTLRMFVVCIGSGLLMLLLRALLFFVGWQESGLFGIKLDVFYLPLAAGVIAGICSATRSSREWLRLSGISLLVFLAFAVTGSFLSDLGLLWVGGMALLLVLPFEFRQLRSLVASFWSVGIFLLLFLTPKIFPQAFLAYLQQEEDSVLRKANILYPDPLQVRRDRDYYRMMDAVAPDEVRLIPAQLASEVTVERFRLRYQALKGAWREGLRSGEAYGSSWSGAGLLQARPVVGERSFREAARSDYVYQIYVRAEYGTAGVLALLVIYLSLLIVPLAGHGTNSPPGSSLAIWAVAIAAGSALFMLGGVHGIFPFSGKWTFFMALGSRSDFCLSTALLVLAAGGQYNAK